MRLRPTCNRAATGKSTPSTQHINIGDDKKVTSVLRGILHIILCALPTILIESLALISLKDISVEGNLKYIILTHISALACLFLTLFKPKVLAGVKWLVCLATPFAVFLMVENLTHDPFLKTDGKADMTSEVILLNIAIYAIGLLVLTFITGHTAPAVISVTVIPLTLGLISYFTLSLRGSPLFPWDLASYGIAATVVSDYDIALTPPMLMTVSLAIFLCVASVVWNVRVKFTRSFIRPVCAVLMCAVTLATSSYIQSDRAISDFRLYPYLFTPVHLYKTNGFAVSFLMNLRYATVDKPDGYSNNAVSDIASDYVSDTAADSSGSPNVIVIMNESFADMTYLCDYSTTSSCMPFISSLEKNTLKGKLHVSVVGGNTPNSEFEFLTGMTMGTLPSGSIPYQQFIKSEHPSLVSQFNSLGYRTVAMHPYGASGWERDDVYSYFGFDETYFLNRNGDIFKNKPRLRTYVSDSGLYESIYELYEGKDADEPLFVFAVTMQNHSSYNKSYRNFLPDTAVKGLLDNVPLTNYMSLIRESDRAFGELIRYFSQVKEDTVVLMFGDHQPNDSIANPLLKQAGISYDESDLESSENRYTVPYVLWSNFDSEYEKIGDLSLNYMASVLTDYASIPQTAHQKQLMSLMEQYPVITGRCIIDSDGTYSPVSSYAEFDGLPAYAIMQYNYLFDKSNIAWDFFNLKK